MMPKFIDINDIDAFDLRIDIDRWIVVQDYKGRILLRERAEIGGQLVVTASGVVAGIEPLWSWMALHLQGIVEEHKALLVAVSPDITDAERKIIKACLSAFSPILLGFVEIQVAAAYDLARLKTGP